MEKRVGAAIELALVARGRSYSRYSDFPMGAAAVDAAGRSRSHDGERRCFLLSGRGYRRPMARYVVHVRTPLDQTAAFDYMADLTNFARWDPGVREAEQVEGTTPVLDAEYDITVDAVPKPLVLRYRITAFDPHRLVVARAESRLLTSLDRITVAADDDGTVVTYDAELTLNGPLGLADPILGLAFQRIGDRAAAGLTEALDGKQVEWDKS